MRTHTVRTAARRAGFTLMELLVVVAILAVLAALIVPRISGVTEQTYTATNASLLQGVNAAEARYEAQFGQIPTAWDGVLSSGGTLYTKLHPKIAAGALDANGTTLTTLTLSAMQAQSLNDAGMVGIHYNDEGWTGFPSESGRTYAPVAANTKMASMAVSSSVNATNFDSVGHNVLFSDRAFSIHPYTAQWSNNFVVVGFGNEATLKRNAVQDTPLFQSAQPALYYARALCVFMVPAASVTSTTDAGYFKAKYVGSFCPDGTCLMDNLDTYGQQATPQ